MKARDLMSKNPASVTPETSIRDAARLMKSEDVGVLPVVESEGSKRVVGLVTDRDITVRAVAEGRSDASVRDVMTSDPKTAREDDDVDSVMSLMGNEQVRRVPIVDDRGQLVGIVAQADIIREASDRKAERTVEKISQPGGKHTS
jgi:CBS domain-containing protein